MASVMLVVGWTAPARAQVNTAEATQMLQSESPDEVRLGLESLGAANHVRAVAPLAARIRAGLPPDLLDAAVLALTVLGKPEAGPVLFELLRHRRAEVRIASVDALVATRPRGAEAALIAALSDADSNVRSAAAVGLGQVGGEASIDALFHALDRNILEASTAIGQLAPPAAMERLVGYLGRVPFDALTPAFAELFARANVPERAKLQLIGRLEELATPEVKIYLADLAESFPPGNLQRAAEEASIRIAE